MTYNKNLTIHNIFGVIIQLEFIHMRIFKTNNTKFVDHQSKQKINIS